MRRRARLDVNHREIVKALRAVGASVLSLAAVGSSVPDLLVGFGGVTYLLEIKRADGLEANTLAKKVRLRDQAEWRAKWRGGPAVEVRTAAEALAAAGATGPAAEFIAARDKATRDFFARMHAPEVEAARSSPRRK